MRLMFLLLLVTALIACGQTGSLYLPKHPPGPPARSAPEAASGLPTAASGSAAPASDSGEATALPTTSGSMMPSPQAPASSGDNALPAAGGAAALAPVDSGGTVAMPAASAASPDMQALTPAASAAHS